MSSRLLRNWIATNLLLAVLSSHAALAFSADGIRLSVVPDKCISLLKGQTCYQRVQFRWKTHDPAGVQQLLCLWREGDSAALRCWEEASEGIFRYNLEASETTNFLLVVGRERQPVIDRAMVEVSWVYSDRRSRGSRWRLF